jgi:hypothetical protein
VELKREIRPGGSCSTKYDQCNPSPDEINGRLIIFTQGNINKYTFHIVVPAVWRSG